MNMIDISTDFTQSPHPSFHPLPVRRRGYREDTPQHLHGHSPNQGWYTLERIQQKRPDVWQIISAELVPGLEDWVAAVKSRSSEELPAFERVNGYLALLQWELLATFLHDIPHHFFKHRTSPVFLDLPVFQNAVFTDWLLGDFRHQILQLQLKADVCYKHIRDKRKETTKLETVCSERPPPWLIPRAYWRMCSAGSQPKHTGSMFNRRLLGLQKRRLQHATCTMLGI
ncbi:TPA: hypothetical protein ACH3X1_014813 [Trebouxia sp. C0004]